MIQIQTPLQVGCYTVPCGPRPYDMKDFPNLIITSLILYIRKFLLRKFPQILSYI
jgi:hypothetical protein